MHNNMHFVHKAKLYNYEEIHSLLTTFNLNITNAHYLYVYISSNVHI